MSKEININSLSDFELAILIRVVEEKFLKLFEEGSLNGTVHTCIGQELSAVSLCRDLKKNDYVFSNHRCHGHFISFTKEYYSLISEIMGKVNGICGGIGGSQHLCNKNFFSNGPQGSLTPVALGAAKSCQLSGNNNVVVCFIGDGTMGEGIIYESMNMASLFKVPILFVCENNLYAQSTPISKNLAGSIKGRASSFGLKIFEADTWDYNNLSIKAKEAIKIVRSGCPAFFKVDTYRLKAHSKGDDDRNKEEIEHYKSMDVLSNELITNKSLKSFYKKIKLNVDAYVNEAKNYKEMNLNDYMMQDFKTNKKHKVDWEKHKIKIHSKQVSQINKYFDSTIKNNDKTILIGEDIDDPYGGAFKVTKGLSTKYQNNIISTPISEAGIVGMGIGMSILGYKPFIEIMFGDFITYAFDQILSNASKFFYMYNKQVSVPITIRAPMGGGRGYGPTHSQSIEKIFNGLNNIRIVALNTLIDATCIFESLENSNHTIILIENKIDYGRMQNTLPKTIKYNFKKSNMDFPIIVGSPDNVESDISIITYGGSIHHVLESIDKIFYEFEMFPKIILLTEIYPIPFPVISSLVSNTKNILTVEEGNIEGGIGSEIIAGLIELIGSKNKNYKRIGSANVPIPSSKKLEKNTLINSEMILSALRNMI